ncbi:MAG: hypothetical protein EON55_03735 [Alphaproteobacteria bacterium]|nr:MAG: hypothetical protein EON55_03735 [Alphaproteobacteria bacterium]
MGVLKTQINLPPAAHASKPPTAMRQDVPPGVNRMARKATSLLVYGVLWAFIAPHATHAQDATQPFTLACINNGGKSIYFSIDLASNKWALMKPNGELESKIQEVALQSDDVIKLKNPGGYFLVIRKTGAMDLIKGESRKVDRISCRKHDSLIPIPVDKRPANKF